MRSIEELKAKMAQKQKAIKESTGQRARAVSIPQGKHRFRLLPNKEDINAEFSADYALHYIKEEDPEKPGKTKIAATYICTHHTFGKPCEVCQALEYAADQATDDTQLALIEDAKCNSSKNLVNMVKIVDGKPEANPVLYQLTPTTFEKIIELWLTYLEDGVNILDLEEGHDLIINREGSGKNSTTYSVAVAPKASSIDAKYLDLMEDLQAFVQQENEKGLQRAIGAVNATVGIISHTAPKLVESKPKAAISDDDMMSVMEEAVGEIEEAEIEVKRTGTDDAPIASTSSVDDLDDLDDLDIDDMLKDI